MEVSFMSLLLLMANTRTVFLQSTAGNCPSSLLASVMGNTLSHDRNGLIALSFTLQNRTLSAPMIKILQYKQVCKASGLYRNTVSSVSVIVRYDCFGSACPSGDSTRTNQFQFDCNEPLIQGDEPSYSKPELSVYRGDIRRDNPIGNIIFTSLNDQCSNCIDPVSSGLDSHSTTHCFPCPSECNEGQRRCVGTKCCNWYLDDACVATCPSSFVGNLGTYICESNTISMTTFFVAIITVPVIGVIISSVFVFILIGGEITAKLKYKKMCRTVIPEKLKDIPILEKSGEKNTITENTNDSGKETVNSGMKDWTRTLDMVEKGNSDPQVAREKEEMVVHEREEPEYKSEDLEPKMTHETVHKKEDPQPQMVLERERPQPQMVPGRERPQPQMVPGREGPQPQMVPGREHPQLQMVEKEDPQLQNVHKREVLMYGGDQEDSRSEVAGKMEDLQHRVVHQEKNIGPKVAHEIDNSEPKMVCEKKSELEAAHEKEYSEPGKVAGEKEYSEPTGEKEYSEPTGEKEYSEPTGEKEYSEPTGEKDYSEPAGEKEYSEPVDEKEYSEPEVGHERDDSEPKVAHRTEMKVAPNREDDPCVTLSQTAADDSSKSLEDKDGVVTSSGITESHPTKDSINLGTPEMAEDGKGKDTTSSIISPKSGAPKLTLRSRVTGIPRTWFRGKKKRGKTNKVTLENNERISLSSSVNQEDESHSHVTLRTQSAVNDSSKSLKEKDDVPSPSEPEWIHKSPPKCTIKTSEKGFEFQIPAEGEVKKDTSHSTSAKINVRNIISNIKETWAGSSSDSSSSVKPREHQESMAGSKSVLSDQVSAPLVMKTNWLESNEELSHIRSKKDMKQDLKRPPRLSSSTDSSKTVSTALNKAAGSTKALIIDTETQDSNQQRSILITRSVSYHNSRSGLSSVDSSDIGLNPEAQSSRVMKDKKKVKRKSSSVSDLTHSFWKRKMIQKMTMKRVKQWN